MSTPIQTPQLPIPAIYRRQMIRWNDNGTKYFVPIEERVTVVAETEKSYQIKYDSNNKLSWVGKNKIKFVYLRDKDYCEKKQKRMWPMSCRICYEKCGLRGKDYPLSY